MTGRPWAKDKSYSTAPKTNKGFPVDWVDDIGNAVDSQTGCHHVLLTDRSVRLPAIGERGGKVGIGVDVAVANCSGFLREAAGGCSGNQNLERSKG